jgi:hypothetical protein
MKKNEFIPTFHGFVEKDAVQVEVDENKAEISMYFNRKWNNGLIMTFDELFEVGKDLGEIVEIIQIAKEKWESEHPSE